VHNGLDALLCTSKPVLVHLFIPMDQGRSSLRFAAADTNRQEVEELSADARRGGRDPRRSFFLMHRMASYRWLFVLICMGRRLASACCVMSLPSCLPAYMQNFFDQLMHHGHMGAGRG
jgi:hypothetical protein